MYDNNMRNAFTFFNNLEVTYHKVSNCMRNNAEI